MFRRRLSVQGMSRFFINARSMDIKTRFSFTTLIATWFYVGKFPIMPGTFASIATYPIYYFTIISSLSYDEVFLSLLCITLLLWIIGLYSISVFQKETGSFDHQMVVIDEVVGQLLTFTISYKFLASISTSLYLLFRWVDFGIINMSFVFGLIAFRFFDITKPLFIRFVDRNYKGAFGVMLDDILAALFASCVIYVLYSIFSYLL